jgi:hypothetical protein
MATAAPAAAQSTTVSPGQFIYLGTSVRRGVECFIGYDPDDCSGSRWRSPGLPTAASGNHIRGTLAPDLPIGLGLDNRAIAWLEYEFSVAGTTGFVNVELAIKYDLDAQLAGSGAYAANSLLTATLTDISDPNQAYLASVTLWDRNRQGDQGVTDIAGGGEHYVFNGEVGHLQTVLPRGRNYRLRISAQGSGSMVVVGDVHARAEAVVQYVRVLADEDEFEAIQLHDQVIQQKIAAHDANIAQRLATHDADIKALLNQMKAAQLEIIRLLLTAHGQRESTYCPSGGTCSFPGGK